MRLSVSTDIDCTPERAWTHTLATGLLNEVTGPLLTFEPIDPVSFPAVWADGGVYPMRLSTFRVFPLGTHRIETQVVRIDPTPGVQTYCLRDNGHGDLAARWDHRMRIKEVSGRTRYTDEIHVEAGVLTVFLWLCAHVLYRYRQFRLRRILIDDAN